MVVAAAFDLCVFGLDSGKVGSGAGGAAVAVVVVMITAGAGTVVVATPLAALSTEGVDKLSMRAIGTCVSLSPSRYAIEYVPSAATAVIVPG